MYVISTPYSPLTYNLNSHSNKVNKHYHCTRCGFSFVRYQTLESHAEKHQQEEEGGSSHSLGPQSPIYLKKPRPDSPMETPAASGDPESPSKAQGWFATFVIMKYILYQCLPLLNYEASK